MGLGTIALMGIMLIPGQGSPDVAPMNQRSMHIPIHFEAARRNEIRQLLLFVSNNQGEKWEQAGTATPDKDSFNYIAPDDGIYWFSMVEIDKQGNRIPADINSAPPGLKVLVDTQHPLIRIRSAERVGDEVTVSWEVQEKYPDFGKFQLQYKSTDGRWNTIVVPDQDRLNPGSTRFKAPVGGITAIKLLIEDLAKNPGEATKDVTTVAVNPAPVLPNPLPNDTQGVKRVDATLPIIQPELTPQPANTGLPVIGESVSRPAPQPVINPQNNQLNEIGSTVSTGSDRGMLPKAEVINVTKLDLEYDIEDKGPSGVKRAEVWVTRDDGKNWVRWTASEKMDGKITVDMSQRGGNNQPEGTYGFKIVLVSGAGLSRGKPVAGDLPDARVHVDLTKPVVRIFEPLPHPTDREVMLLRWQALDNNLMNEPITIEWAEKPEGPWYPVVSNGGSAEGSISNNKRIENSGNYHWKVPTGIPARVYLKVTARDEAGNIAEAKSRDPILVDLSKPEAKIRGIVGTNRSDP